MAREPNPPKRPRGRPRVPKYDDGPTLRKVAELLSENPGMKPTAAMRKILERPEESTLHRLRAQWRRQRSELLACAKQRRESETMQSQKSNGLAAFPRNLEYLRALNTALNVDVIRSAASALSVISLPDPKVMRSFQKTLGIWKSPGMLELVTQMTKQAKFLSSLNLPYLRIR